MHCPKISSTSCHALHRNAGRSRRWLFSQWPIGQRVAALLMVFLVLVSVGCRHRPGGGPLARGVGHAQRGVYHTVKRHQTFWRICKTYGVDMAEVARVNGIKDKTKIEMLQKLFFLGVRFPRSMPLIGSCLALASLPQFRRFVFSVYRLNERIRFFVGEKIVAYGPLRRLALRMRRPPVCTGG